MVLQEWNTRTSGRANSCGALPDEQQEEACFRQDLGIACCQQVKLLELQAAMSLERLWQR
jgi:hypothetical protein